MHSNNPKCVICRRMGVLYEYPFGVSCIMCSEHAQECITRVRLIEQFFYNLKENAKKKAINGYIEHKETLEELRKRIDIEIGEEIIDILVYLSFRMKKVEI